MNKIEYEFIQHIFEKISDKNVVEIGSWMAEWQQDLSIRNMISKRNKYIGLDMRSGPNVDVVCNSHKTPISNHSVDIVICLNTLEHDDDPFQTMKEIRRIVKPKGLVIVSAPFNFLIHSFPNDYFRYTPESYKILGKAWTNKEIYCWGNKYVPDGCIALLSDSLIEDYNEYFVKMTKKYLGINLSSLIRRIWWEFNRSGYKL